ELISIPCGNVSAFLVSRARPLMELYDEGPSSGGERDADDNCLRISGDLVLLIYGIAPGIETRGLDIDSDVSPQSAQELVNVGLGLDVQELNDFFLLALALRQCLESIEVFEK